MQQNIEPVIGHNKRASIEKPKVVLCEGLEEALFFPRFFKILNRVDLLDNIQFFTYDGKAKLLNFLKNGLVKMPGFNLISSLGVMMDADGEPEGVQPSFESVQYALNSISFPVPNNPGEVAIKTIFKSIVWILPDNQSQGEFENICIKALTNHLIFPCLEPLKQCIQSRGCAIPRSAKAPFYTILAWNEPCGRRINELSDHFISSWDLSVFDNLITHFFNHL